MSPKYCGSTLVGSVVFIRVSHFLRSKNGTSLLAKLKIATAEV